MNPTSFDDLRLSEPLRRALAAESYLRPTPIQALAIPHILTGRDVLGTAQTGTGKTAAFVLPILQRLSGHRSQPKTPRGLVLAPTRELAVQIAERAAAYGRYTGLTVAVICGGAGPQQQIAALSRGTDLVVATPGRLLDLMGQRHLRLDRVAIVVLDEADRMLDMGFVRDVRRILAALPRTRQSLLFSATMPDDVLKLAAEMLQEPERISVTPAEIVVQRIEQKVFFVQTAKKRDLLNTLLRDPALSRVLVFTRTKHGAKRLSAQLQKSGIASDAIHGNRPQSGRIKALNEFRAGRVRVLVATDVAARGIDVPQVTHVINFDLPNLPESYVHRIGRTGRAGAGGFAWSFCDPSEGASLAGIERLIRRRLSPEDPRRPTGKVAGAGPAGRGHDAAGRGRRRPAERGERLTA